MLEKGDSVKKEAKDLLLIFGAHNIEYFDKDTLQLPASDVIIHPDWNPEAYDYNADIAILIASEEIEFTKYIQPVCIQKYMNLTNVDGWTAGWGVNEFGQRVSEPTEVKMPVVENGICLVQNPNLAKLSSNKTFCAGSKDGRGPCSGDSGGGLYVYNKNQARYSLQGIVSSGLIDYGTKSCDLRNYVVYTNMNYFYDWLTKLCK